MKKIYIISFLLIAAGIAVLMNMTKDVSSYATFADASRANGDVKIVGTLDKEMPMEYDPQNKPNEFTFYLLDAEGISKKIILSKPKPMEFQNVEQIVLTGKMDGNEFVAHEMLTKCPSKYKNEEIFIKT